MIRKLLRPLKWIGVFCLILVWAFCAAGFLGNALFAMAWVGFAVLLIVGLADMRKEWNGR